MVNKCIIIIRMAVCMPGVRATRNGPQYARPYSPIKIHGFVTHAAYTNIYQLI